VLVGPTCSAATLKATPRAAAAVVDLAASATCGAGVLNAEYRFMVRAPGAAAGAQASTATDVSREQQRDQFVIEGSGDDDEGDNGIDDDEEDDVGPEGPEIIKALDEGILQIVDGYPVDMQGWRNQMRRRPAHRPARKAEAFGHFSDLVR
jgi:hypothetical protein